MFSRRSNQGVESRGLIRLLGKLYATRSQTLGFDEATGFELAACKPKQRRLVCEFVLKSMPIIIGSFREMPEHTVLFGAID
ncbi:hypothetical protein MalM25_07770 [Planctomycetes bacterium MalM25]|nr:hypothetical protein MalM25_07770 [Planctomycetes bacterium MalM25]